MLMNKTDRMDFFLNPATRHFQELRLAPKDTKGEKRKAAMLTRNAVAQR